MTCQTDHARLNDYVDGALTPIDAAQVEAHLAACLPCRSLATDLRRIRAMARSLDPLVPPPHVWQSISAATRPAAASGRRDSRWSSLRAFVVIWQPAAATAVAAVLVTGLWWVGDRLAMPGGAVAPTASIESVAGSAFGDVAHREVRYTATIAQLEALARAERDALDPSLVDVLDSGMDVIDRAIDQSRAAVEANPESDAARESLFQALRTKVALLQNTLELVNDRPHGEITGP